MSSPQERVEIIQRGVAALRAIEAARLEILPSPDRDDSDLLADVRSVQQLADRLDFLAELEGFDDVTVRLRDCRLSLHFNAEDIAAYEDLAADVGAGTPYRAGRPSSEHANALLALAELGRRYDRGEFMPPASFFGITSPEA